MRFPCLCLVISGEKRGSIKEDAVRLAATALPALVHDGRLRGVGGCSASLPPGTGKILRYAQDDSGGGAGLLEDGIILNIAKDLSR